MFCHFNWRLMLMLYVCDLFLLSSNTWALLQPKTLALTALFFFLSSITSGPKGQRSQAKSQKQLNRINIHFTNAGSQAINLLSWTWCAGNLTRMFPGFNYSPKSPSPAGIWKLFQSKVHQRQERETSDISVYDRVESFTITIFKCKLGSSLQSITDVTSKLYSVKCNIPLRRWWSWVCSGVYARALMNFVLVNIEVF